MKETKKERKMNDYMKLLKNVVYNEALSDMAKIIYIQLLNETATLTMNEAVLGLKLHRDFGLSKEEFYEGINELLKLNLIFIRKKEIDELTVNTNLIRSEVSTEATEPEVKPRRKLTREMLEKLELRTEEKPKPSKYEMYKRMDLLTEEDRTAFENLTKFD